MCVGAEFMTAIFGSAQAAQTAATVLQVAGAAATAKAYSDAAGAQAALNERQADINENQAKLADAQAVDAARKGKEEERALRVRYAALTGEQRLALGASGADVNTGNSLSLLGDTAYALDQDAQTIRINSRQNSDALRRTGQSYRYEAELNRWQAGASRAQGKSAVIGGAISGVGTILSNASLINPMKKASLPVPGYKAQGMPQFNLKYSYGR